MTYLLIISTFCFPIEISKKFDFMVTTPFTWITTGRPKHYFEEKKMADCGLFQTCQTSADPRNSAFFDFPGVIFVIRPDPMRIFFFPLGVGGLDFLRNA